METTAIMATIVTMTKKNVSTCANTKWKNKKTLLRGSQETCVLQKKEESIHHDIVMTKKKEKVRP
jgi:hypothetical protein